MLLATALLLPHIPARRGRTASSIPAIRAELWEGVCNDTVTNDGRASAPDLPPLSCWLVFFIAGFSLGSRGGRLPFGCCTARGVTRDVVPIRRSILKPIRYPRNEPPALGAEWEPRAVRVEAAAGRLGAPVTYSQAC